MLAQYNKRLKELESDPYEMYQYMAKSAPFLFEYERTKNRKDLFQKFMQDVEGETGTSHTPVENVCMFLNCENCQSSNLFYDDNTHSPVKDPIKRNRRATRISCTATSARTTLTNGSPNSKRRRLRTSPTRFFLC